MSFGWTTGRRVASFFLKISPTVTGSLQLRQPFSSEAQETARSHFHMNRQQDMLSRFGHFLLVTLVRFNCARNSGVEHVSRLQGCGLNAEGLRALSRILHAMWMHLFSSTSSPLVPYLMRAFLSRSGLGPSRFLVGFGSRLVGCVRRFCPPPPPLVGFLARRPSAFSFSLPFQGLPVSGQVCWCWCSLFFLSLLRSPSCVPVK